MSDSNAVLSFSASKAPECDLEVTRSGKAKKGQLSSGQGVTKGDQLADGNGTPSSSGCSLYNAAWWGGVALGVAALIVAGGFGYLWATSTQLTVAGFEITQKVAMYAAIAAAGFALVDAAVLGVTTYLCRAQDPSKPVDGDAPKSSFWNCFGLIGGSKEPKTAKQD